MRRLGFTYPDPRPLPLQAWILIGVVVTVVLGAVLTGCDDLRPACADMVLKPDRWYGKDQCTHPRHVAVHEGEFWVCHCQRPDGGAK